MPSKLTNNIEILIPNIDISATAAANNANGSCHFLGGFARSSSKYLHILIHFTLTIVL